jgi:hypothetical protein
MKVGVFPEAFLRAMSAGDRRAIGQPTMAEAERQYERGQEKELKRDVLNWKARKPNSPRKTGLAVANPPAPIELILTQVTRNELRTRRRRRQTF